MQENSGTALARAIGEYREEVEVKGKKLNLVPLQLRQFVDVLACIDELVDAGVVKISGSAGETLEKVDPVKIILRGGDPALKILQIATAQPPSWINSLNLVDAAKLAGGVFKVNWDFFTENQEALMAAFGPAWTSVKELLPGGQPQSSDSSQADIP